MSPPRRFNRVLSYWFSFCSPHRLVSVRMHLMLNARSTHRRRKQKSQFHSNELITKAILSSRTHKKNFFLAMLSRKKNEKEQAWGKQEENFKFLLTATEKHSGETLKLTCTKLLLQKCSTPTSIILLAKTKLHLWYICIFIGLKNLIIQLLLSCFATRVSLKLSAQKI